MKSLKILIHVISWGTVFIFHPECYFITNHVNWQLIVNTLLLWSLCKLTADHCMISWCGNRKSCIQTSMRFVSHPRPTLIPGPFLYQPHLLLPVCTTNPVTDMDIGLSTHREAKSQQWYLSGGYESAPWSPSPPQVPFYLQEIKSIEPKEIKFSKFQSKSFCVKFPYLCTLSSP